MTILETKLIFQTPVVFPHPRFMGGRVYFFLAFCEGWVLHGISLGQESEEKRKHR